MEKKRSGRRGSVTLTDVAQAAGVSQITVSRILRDKGPVAEETRQRVLAAVRRTGYVPNRLAGGLASSGSRLVGVIIPSLSNIVFPEVLRGVHAALDGTGFEAVVAVSDYGMAHEERLVSSLLAWQLEAIVVTGLRHTKLARTMLERCNARIAEVMEIDSAPIDVAVGLSHRRAGFDMGRYLVELGYRRFGYVGHDWDADYRARLRYDGLMLALDEAGLTLLDEERFDGPSSTQVGREMLRKLLARTRGLDVVVFSNDDMATGGMFHCMGAGIRLKQDLAIFGFNGLDIGQALPMPLSTVRSNRFLIGKLAVEKLLEQRERPKLPTVIDTGYEIVVGATA